MAKCEVCEKDKLKAEGCAKHVYLLNDGTQIKAVKVGGPRDWVEEPDEKCDDCGAQYGHYHHVGCDIERCGNCGGQFISCACDYSNELLIIK